MKMRLVVLMAILAVIATVVPVSASDHHRDRRDNRGSRSHVDRSRNGNRHVARRSSAPRHNVRSSRNHSNNYRSRGRYNNRYGYNDYNYRYGIRINFPPVVVVHTESSDRDEELAYAQGELAELRAEREQQRRETPRETAASVYYGEVAQTPPPVVQPPPAQVYTTENLQSQPKRFTVINGTPDIICVKGKTLNPHSSDRATVSDPTDIEVSAPSGSTICPTDAEYISTDTIMVVCVSQKGR